MIEVKPGDSVKLPDGTIVEVLGYYNQGHHRVFKLKGDKTATDIHKCPGAEVISDSKTEVEFDQRNIRTATIEDPIGWDANGSPSIEDESED